MPLSHDIWQAVAQEFSDLPGPAEIVPLVLRALLGMALGGALGYQRERSGKAAGLRTHMLVCLGTALFVAIPQQARLDGEALSRVIQGITAGIGFLGAGSILKDVRRLHIEGLTTAASIWLTAAIGIAVGLGRESSAVLGTLLALAVLSLVPHLSRDRAGPKEDRGRGAGQGAPPPDDSDGEAGAG